MINNPKVSVIIPAYNCKAWLRDCLNSVFSQTYKNTEVIVINDGSIENLDDIVSEYKNVRYIKNSNHGVAFTRNFGIKVATGDYIAFLDSDDFWDSSKIEIQINEMIQNKSSWSQHSYYYFDNNENKVSKVVDTSIYKNAKKHVFTSFKIQTSMVMVKRSVLLDNPEIRFDENRKTGEDAVFYIEMLKKYELLSIDKTLGYFRIRGNNSGFSSYVQIESRRYAYKKYKNDPFFKHNTNFVVKFAFRYCSFLMRFFKKNSFLCNVCYFPAWVIFKLA